MGVTNQVLSLRQSAEDTNNLANSSKSSSSSSKMKVLKKVKRRLGLASRGVSSGNPSANNLPPLLFHQVHGDNIRVSRDGRIARRAESFCKGVTFSARPVKVSEKICVKFLEVSTNWSGVLRFGFTSNDPSTLRYGLPKYACPDLTNKPGYWAKALAERLCERDTVLFYYVTSAGDVHFGVNGEEKGVFFSGVDTRGQLWAMIDVYGNSTAIEFLDSRQQLNNSRSSRHIEGQEVDRLITPAMVNLSIHPPPPCVPQPAETPAVIETPPPPRFQHPSVKFNPLPFHRTRGRNVRLSNDRCIAMRNATEFCQGYVFTGRPLQLGERVVVQILATEPMYLGAMALGLTSCDPASLTPADLPDDSDLLLDRPEYWVVSKDVTNYPQQGDELAFCITHSGEVQMSKNGSPPVTLMHVDQSLTLWAFLDIYGSTQKIRILGSTLQQQPSGSSPPRAVVPSSSERCCPVTVTTATGVGGGTVLVVNLPPVQPAAAPAASHQHPPVSIVSHPPPQHPPPSQHPDPSHSATLVSNYSNTYIEPVTATSYSTIESAAGIREWAEASISSPQSSDCSVCYERAIDSVLYTCGHMCMCYECAVQQWRGKGGGHCPICRALIRDVIRTFKS